MTSLQPTLPPGYTLHATLPSAPAYRALRADSGLLPVTASMAHGAVTGSWYGCHVTYQAPSSSPTSTTTPVAMGRIIGDGGWYFHIADMATLPAHQRKGLGGAVMRHLLAHIKDNSPADGTPFVNLFADPPGRRLYAQCGFVESALLDEMGMVLGSSAGFTPGAQAAAAKGV